MKRAFGLMAIVAVLLAGAPALAHHATQAEFDQNNVKTITGVMTKVMWVNPHVNWHLDVKNPDGTTTEWMIEAATPNTLLRRGFTRDTVKAGTEITVVGYQAKNGAPRANGRDLILADGSRLFMGSSETGAPGDAAKGEPAQQ